MFIEAVFPLLVLFFSIVIHEIAHGSMALLLGDTTAKREGRLTLNPIKHVDLFGTIILPLLLFILRAGIIVGWAKPVPVNPYNFKDQKWGMLKVSLAGPATNILIAILFGLLIRFVNLSDNLAVAFSIISFYNLYLALFNLLPIPPLDGSHILFSFFSKGSQNIKNFLHQYGIAILLLFLFFGVGILFRVAVLFYSLIVGNLPLL